MPKAGATTEPVSGPVPHRYHPLRVKQVIAETDDAVSIVFDIPDDRAEVFAYVPGQFVTLRLVVDGETRYRSYSMSSSPAVDADLQVTVKRVPGGVVSNWLVEHATEGDVLDVSTPTGAFVLTDTEVDIVAFAAGSGITPVFSIVKSALHTTSRRVRLLFANRQRDAAIFGDALDGLAARHTERLEVEHHEDVVQGFVDATTVTRFIGASPDAVVYICGPGGFMDVVETALLDGGVEPGRIHLERFTPPAATASPIDVTPSTGVAPASVTITVGRETKTVDQRGTSSILESARSAGLPAPSSCESGHCATCMARVVEGQVEMAKNDVLTDDELADGWVLTCQARPSSPVVRVVYEP